MMKSFMQQLKFNVTQGVVQVILNSWCFIRFPNFFKKICVQFQVFFTNGFFKFLLIYHALVTPRLTYADSFAGNNTMNESGNYLQTPASGIKINIRGK